MKTYLIIEDDPGKANAYSKFRDHYADRGVTFHTVSSPNAAITGLQNGETRSRIAGVIADFELGGRRIDNRHKRIQVAGPGGDSYTISTGLGVLDWVHSLEPILPLWALTNDAATHAPLFMSAASVWLDAKPLHVDRLTEVGTARSDRMLEELLEPQYYSRLNPLWARIDNSRAAFHELLNTPYSSEEAFDWLNALTHLHGAPGGFIPTLNNKIRQITLNPKLSAYAHTLSPAMAKWQLRLEEIYQDFPVDREEDRWPKLDEDDLPTGLKAWAEFNPITDFFGAHNECQEFFEAEDVRMALTRWRGRGERP